MTRPCGGSGVQELAERERAITPQGGSTSPPVDADERDRVAGAASGLFADRALAEIRVADVAAAAGVPTAAVYEAFGGVSGVAAWTWVRDLPELEAISAAAVRSASPEAAVEGTMARFVELGRNRPAAVEALVVEVLARAEGDEVDDLGDALRAVPEVLVPALQELRRRGLLRRGVDTRTLSWSIVLLASIRMLLTPDDSVERIVDDTVGLALDGALVPRSGR